MRVRLSTLALVCLALLGTATRAAGQAATTVDLVVAKADSPDPVTAGGLITYTITFSNTGTGPANNVNGSDTIPANTAFAAFGSISQGVAVFSAGVITISFGAIPAGGSATLTYQVTVNPATPPLTVILNTVTGTTDSPETSTANNSFTANTQVVAGVPTMGEMFRWLLIASLPLVGWLALRRRSIAADLARRPRS